MFQVPWTWLLLVCGLVSVSKIKGINVPASFSYDHKEYTIGEVSLKSILQIIGSYEVDSHMEVVLIGEAFDSVYEKELSDNLEELSLLSSFASPLLHIHEKIIYHVSYESSMTKKISEVLSSSQQQQKDNNRDVMMDGIDPSLVTSELSKYHQHGSGSTSLFVIQSKTKSTSFLGLGSTMQEEEHFYKSPLSIDGEESDYLCKKKSFVGDTSAFAWIDLTAQESWIIPRGQAENVLYSPSVQEWIEMAENRNEHIHSVANLVHRSGEHFFSFPVFLSPYSNHGKTQVYEEEYTKSDSYNNPMAIYQSSTPRASSADYYFRKINFLKKGHEDTKLASEVKLLVIHVCIPSPHDVASTFTSSEAKEANIKQKCEADTATMELIQELRHIHGNQFMQIYSEILAISTVEEPQLAHAIHTSMRVQVNNEGEEVNVLDSRELVYWLSMSSFVRNLLAEYLYESHSYYTLLPMFVFTTDTSVTNMFIDSQWKTSTVIEFPPSPSVARRDARSIKGNSMKTRDNTNRDHFSIKDNDFSGSSTSYNNILEDSNVVQSAILSIRPRERINEKVTNFMTCGGSEVKGNANDAYKEEINIHIHALLWGISPPYMHFSGASHSIVQDFLWYTPLSIRNQGTSASVAQNIHDDLEEPVMNSNRTFTDGRSVKRHHFIHEAEQLLRRLTSVITDASTTVPPVDVRQLLDIDLESLKEMAKQEKAGMNRYSSSRKSSKNADLNKIMSGGSSGKSPSAPISERLKDPTLGHFQAFLYYMESAAVEFSHLDYALATMQLSNAHSRVNMIESRLDEIIMLRSGTLVCGNSSYESSASNSEHPQDIIDEIEKSSLKDIARQESFEDALLTIPYQPDGPPDDFSMEDKRHEQAFGAFRTGPEGDDTPWSKSYPAHILWYILILAGAAGGVLLGRLVKEQTSQQRRLATL